MNNSVLITSLVCSVKLTQPLCSVSNGWDDSLSIDINNTTLSRTGTVTDPGDEKVHFSHSFYVIWKDLYMHLLSGIASDSSIKRSLV